MWASANRPDRQQKRPAANVYASSHRALAAGKRNRARRGGVPVASEASVVITCVSNPLTLQLQSSFFGLFVVRATHCLWLCGRIVPNHSAFRKRKSDRRRVYLCGGGLRKRVHQLQRRKLAFQSQPHSGYCESPGGRADGTRTTRPVFCNFAVNTYVCPPRTFSTVDVG